MDVFVEHFSPFPIQLVVLRLYWIITSSRWCCRVVFLIGQYLYLWNALSQLTTYICTSKSSINSEQFSLNAYYGLESL